MEQKGVTYIDIHTHNPRPGVTSPVMRGVHPWDAATLYEFPDLSDAEIVGETGLDGACGVDMEAQRGLFNLHLAEAQRVNKPVVLHVVRSFEEVMNTLSKYKIESVVFHGFIGSVEQAKRATNRGYYLSFGKRSLRSSKSCRALEQTPIDRLFCETDDDPETSIAEIYEKVANLRNISVEELARQIVENYKRVIHKR